MICKLCDQIILNSNNDHESMIYNCSCGFEVQTVCAETISEWFLFKGAELNIWLNNNVIYTYQIMLDQKNHYCFTEKDLNIEDFNKLFDYKNLDIILSKLKMIAVFK